MTVMQLQLANLMRHTSQLTVHTHTAPGCEEKKGLTNRYE